nr:acetylornithine deacetylase [Yoonia tamlensis]
MSAAQLLERLVSFPTVSTVSNLDLIGFVEKYLEGHGIASQRVPNEDGTKAALYAHVGPQIDGGVVLSGHTDVVPVAGQNWDSDPFKLTTRQGKIYGRGTCDMKGFDALAIWALTQAAKADLKRPLQIALSYDEEIGCTGAPPMIDHMVSMGMPRADTVIVGEPSMMSVVTGHKGGIGYKLHFHGFEVHSSLLHTGVSAIMMGAKLIDWANQVNAENAAKTPAARDAGFVPPYTTLHVGTINGGTAHNITAKDCTFDVTFRVVPSESIGAWRDRFLAKVAALAAEMKAIHPDAGITATQFFELPGLAPETDGSAERLARRLTGANASEVVSYGTEAGHFQAQGYSVVVCGPGNIAQAHQPNEYISAAQFEKGEAFMKDLIESLSR